MRRFLWTVALTVVALVGVTLALPFDQRIAWQAAAGTQMFHARWIYERLHDDPAPIDVAVLGSSRMEAGISPVVLGRRLSARIGRPVHVANLAIVMPGRDFAWVTARDLIATHPEVRVIVLSDDGFTVNSHPMFREVAGVREVWAAPLLVNTKYLPNLLYLPWRNVLNAAEQLAPGSFGVTPGFDRAAYPGGDLDRTTGYRLADGTLVNGDRTLPPARLRALSAQGIATQRASIAQMRLFPHDMALAIDHAYVTRIAALARAHGVRLIFVSMPYFGADQPTSEAAAYRAYGPEWSLAGLARAPELFQNGAHLNRAGAVRASTLLGDMIAPTVAAALRPAESHP